MKVVGEDHRDFDGGLLPLTEVARLLLHRYRAELGLRFHTGLPGSHAPDSPGPASCLAPIRRSLDLPRMLLSVGRGVIIRTITFAVLISATATACDL